MGNPIAITAEIITDAEAWLAENVNDLFADNVAVVHRMNKYNAKTGANYQDYEEEETKHASVADHVRALTELCGMVTKTIHLSGINTPHDLTDPGNWDAEVVDVFNQLIFHGKVIYG